jgi:hypothetical protein
MGELILNLIFYAFQGIGFLVRKWILPRISGGRLVVLPLLNEPVGPIWSWKRLPNGQFGIEPIFFSMVFAMFPEYAPRRASAAYAGSPWLLTACAACSGLPAPPHLICPSGKSGDHFSG